VVDKPLPYHNGDRIVAARGHNLSKGQDNTGISWPDYRDMKERAKGFEFFEASRGDQGALSERGNPPQPYGMARVTGEYFTMLGVQPVLGRVLGASDVEADAPPALLISYSVWRDRFGQSLDVLGRTVQVNRQPVTIVGVMPERFGFPNRQDLWMAFKPAPESEDRAQRGFLVVAVRKPGISMAQGSAELNGIAKQLASAYPDKNEGVGAMVMTFHDLQNNGRIRTVFYLMLGAVGFVLLIACANVANMMLSRALGRRREMGIRVAMGASRWRVIRQLLVESVLLSSAGGLIGLLMARYGVAAFDLAVADVGKPSWIEFTMNYQVFAYFAVVCVVSGLLFGLAPGLRASRVDLNETLKEGSRSSGGARGGYLSGVLVVFQVALAVVLLTGSGLMIRGVLLQRDSAADLPRDRVLVASVGLPEQRYANNEARLRFFDQLLTALRSTPGVTNAEVASNNPGGNGAPVRFQLEGEPELAAPQRHPAISVTMSPGYLAMLDVPMRAGRAFDERDGTAGNDNIVVTSDFAARTWLGQSAVGKRLRTYEGPQGQEKPGRWLTVVGVSGDLAQQPDSTHPDPLFFSPYRPGANSFMMVMMRTPGNPAAMAGPLRSAVQQLDADLFVQNVRTLAALVDQQGWLYRVFGTIFSIFAGIALVLASVGIYAVVAQATGRRTREIGVRIALGATSGMIHRLVLSRGVRQMIIGLAIGLPVAFFVSKLMVPILYGVAPSDPLVYVVITVLLTAVGLLACWLPARRAAAMNPVVALRNE